MIASVPVELLGLLRRWFTSTPDGRCFVLLLTSNPTQSKALDGLIYQATGILVLSITSLYVCDDDDNRNTEISRNPMGYNGPLTPDYSDYMASVVQPPPLDLVHTYRMVSSPKSTSS